MLQQDRVATGALISNSGCDAVQILLISVFMAGPLDIGLSVGMLLGCWIGSLAATAVLDSRLFTASDAVSVTRRCLMSKYGWWTLFSRLDWPLLAVSVSLIGALSTSVIFGLQTLLFVPLLQKIGGGGVARWNRVGVSRWFWVTVAFAGMVLSLLGQHQQTESAATISWLRISLGVLVALCGVSAAAGSAARFPLGTQLVQQLGLSPLRRTELAGMVYAQAWTCLAAAIVLGAVAGATGTVSSYSLLGGLLIGAVAYTSGTVTKTVGCLWATNLALNAVSYGTPLVTLGLFVAVGRTTNIHIGLVALGALCVAAANTSLFVSLKQPTL